MTVPRDGRNFTTPVLVAVITLLLLLVVRPRKPKELLSCAGGAADEQPSAGIKPASRASSLGADVVKSDPGSSRRADAADQARRLEEKREKGTAFSDARGVGEAVVSANIGASEGPAIQTDISKDEDAQELKNVQLSEINAPPGGVMFNIHHFEIYKYDEPSLGPINCSDIPFPNVGYKSHRNSARWAKICQEINGDMARGCLRSPTVRFADYGCNQGFFSLAASVKIPRSKVISIDRRASGKSMQPHAMKTHLELIKGTNSMNDAICDANIDGHEFRKMAKLFDYQFVLSFFHWLRYRSAVAYGEHLYLLISNARTTFLELPSPLHPMNSWKISYFQIWYRKQKSLNDILVNALLPHKNTVRVSILSDHYDVEGRFIYRIDNLALGGGCRTDQDKQRYTESLEQVIFKEDVDWCKTIFKTLHCITLEDKQFKNYEAAQYGCNVFNQTAA